MKYNKFSAFELPAAVKALMMKCFQKLSTAFAEKCKTKNESSCLVSRYDVTELRFSTEALRTNMSHDRRGLFPLRI